LRIHQQSFKQRRSGVVFSSLSSARLPRTTFQILGGWQVTEGISAAAGGVGVKAIVHLPPALLLLVNSDLGDNGSRQNKHLDVEITQWFSNASFGFLYVFSVLQLFPSAASGLRGGAGDLPGPDLLCSRLSISCQIKFRK
jgi:hypothetical protein